MSLQKGKTFADKHGPDATQNPTVEKEILSRSKDEQLPCAVAFDIAKRLNVPPGEVGRTTDLLNFRLVKCQLGLFGYTHKSKLISSRHDAAPELQEAIRTELTDGRLPCRTAWEIAARFKVHKLFVSGVCEALDIKIKPCQLGAF